MDPQFFAALAGVVWIDLLLSGDNAVVIAMVCGQLPPRQRTIGILLGAGAAITLRIVMAFFVARLMAVPGLSAAGGVFLLYVAAKLLIDHGGASDRPASATLWSAVVTIAIADAGMSLDNVMAIAALSHGDLWLMAFGVLLSIPIVIAGSALLTEMLARFPILVWAGAGLLGWVAGAIVATDPYVVTALRADPHALHYAASGLGLIYVLTLGLAARQASGTEKSAPADAGAPGAV